MGIIVSAFTVNDMETAQMYMDYGTRLLYTDTLNPEDF
jgi:hypothetical protein